MLLDPGGVEEGAHDGEGGGAMSHVDFKKWQCRMSLSLIFLNVNEF